MAQESKESTIVSSTTTEHSPTVRRLTQTCVVGDNQKFGNYVGIANLAPEDSPAYTKLQITLHPLQEWEGYVVEKGDSDFVAHLVDITSGNSSHAKEEAIIPNEEISERDVEKMQVGSIFRWVIGYERSLAGTKKRVSQIVFRDLPIVTDTDIKQSETWAEVTACSLKS